MDHDQTREILARTLDDGRISRSEKKALRQVVADLSAEDLAAFRRAAFDLARDAAPDAGAGRLIEWLEDVVGVLSGGMMALPSCEVLISPGEDCLRRIQALLGAARDTVDICVYTVTDDRISSRIEDAHERGVKVRIVTDDVKMDDPGSDIADFRTLGIPIRLDGSSHLMHHKFAVFDGHTAVTGSYNWTRSAARVNQENLVVSDDPRLVRPLAEEFERLWEKFSVS
jgi:mitochondrial cardiolipin hydrolase